MVWFSSACFSRLAGGLSQSGGSSPNTGGRETGSVGALAHIAPRAWAQHTMLLTCSELDTAAGREAKTDPARAPSPSSHQASVLFKVSREYLTNIFNSSECLVSTG